MTQTQYFIQVPSTAEYRLWWPNFDSFYIFITKCIQLWSLVIVDGKWFIV